MNEGSINMLVQRVKELEAEVEYLREMLNNPCLKNLKVGEPFFVLKGGDITAYTKVQAWVKQNEGRLGENHHKIISAQKIVHEMMNWSPRKYPD